MTRKEIIAANEISTLCTYTLGGYPQKVLIEGKSAENPVLLVLHGGPGSPIPFSVGCRGLFPEFTDHLTMVYWDQLGCGINDYPIDDTFHISHFVDMTVDLIKAVRKRFPENPLNLLGLSWGSVLAAEAAAAAGKLIDGVVTYGQVLHDLTFNEEVYTALERSHISAKERRYIKAVRGQKEHSPKDAMQVMKLIRKYTEGYQCKSGGKTPIFPMMMGLLKSPDYRFKDFKATMINGYMKNHSLITELTALDLRDTLRKITVPYQILQGSTDIVTPTKHIQDFLSKEDLPLLSLQIVKNCGHMPDEQGMKQILDACMED